MVITVTGSTAAVIGVKSLMGSYGRFFERNCAVTWVLGEVNKIVVPSGAACATASAPIMPFAPPRFSTITVWPVAAVIFGDIRRARMSVPFPGGKGTTIFSGLAGEDWECAGPGAVSPAATIRKKTICRVRCIDLNSVTQLVQTGPTNHLRCTTVRSSGSNAAKASAAKLRNATIFGARRAVLR